MSQLFVSPYINFRGKAREAMQFYQQIFGGDTQMFTGTPDGGSKPAGPNDGIMHAKLESDSVVIMGSDGSPDYPPTVGDNIAIALVGGDSERIAKMFDQLAEGGKINQPLTKLEWGTFGWLRDKYDITWMVNVTQ